jgi:flagellar motor switch protein FliM
MADILDQAQVDALLRAVDSGDVDALQGGAKSAGPLDANVTVYDFKRPERVGKEQLRALERLHEVFARNVSAALSSYMRAVVECSLEEIEQATFQEFVLAAPKTTCLTFLSCAPLQGEVILEINPRIVYVMFDKLIGGSATRSLTPERAMTDIEWRVIDGVLERLRNQLRSAWEGVAALDFKYTSKETNPQLAQNIPPNEPVVLITFELTVGGEESGNMTLCLPHNVIEPVLNRMASFWFSGKAQRSEESTSFIRSKLTTAPVDVVAAFNETELSTSELLRLRAGDVIKIPHKISEPVRLTIDRQLKFIGMPGIFEKRNRKAVRITQVFEQPHSNEEKPMIAPPAASARRA